MKTQRVGSMTIAMVGTLFALSANASMHEKAILDCQQILPNQEIVQLKLKNKGSGAASVEFNSSSKAVGYTAALQDKIESTFSSLYHYSLQSKDGEQAKLSISYWTTSSVGRGGFGCGRGGCDLPTTKTTTIDAELELSNGETFDLSCYEAIN